MKNGRQLMEEYLRPAKLNAQPWQKSATVENEFTRSTDAVEVMLVHEDLQTGLRGKHVLDNLEAKLGMKTRFLVDLWRFDMLREPELQMQAVLDGTRAGIVILSLHGNLELPMHVREWFHRWVRARSASPCALVISLDARVQGTVAADWTLDYLRRASAPAGLDVFPHFATAPGRAPFWHTQQPVRPVLYADSPAETDFRYFGGIND